MPICAVNVCRKRGVSMASQTQIDANRRNAAQSTGPKSINGKYIVSKNAIRHGLLSNDGLLMDEDPAEFARFQARWEQDLAPIGEIEKLLARSIIWLAWRMERAGGGSWAAPVEPVLRVPRIHHRMGRAAISVESLRRYNPNTRRGDRIRQKGRRGDAALGRRSGGAQYRTWFFSSCLGPPSVYKVGTLRSPN